MAAPDMEEKLEDEVETFKVENVELGEYWALVIQFPELGELLVKPHEEPVPNDQQGFKVLLRFFRELVRLDEPKVQALLDHYGIEYRVSQE